MTKKLKDGSVQYVYLVVSCVFCVFCVYFILWAMILFDYGPKLGRLNNPFFQSSQSATECHRVIIAKNYFFHFVGHDFI